MRWRNQVEMILHLHLLLISSNMLGVVGRIPRRLRACTRVLRGLSQISQPGYKIGRRQVVRCASARAERCIKVRGVRLLGWVDLIRDSSCV